MEIPKTYNLTQQQNIYYNCIDHRFYYFSSIDFFNKERYDRIDNVTTPVHHVYLVSTQPKPIIRYSLPQNPIPLKQFFTSNTLTESILLTISRQIIESLATLHSNGIYHGNLSLETIYICPTTYEIAFVDFLFPKSSIVSDPFLPTLHRQITFPKMSSLFQNDIATIPCLLMSPFSNNSFNEFISDPNSQLNKCSPLIGQLLRSYLNSPFPFQTSINFFQAVPDNVDYLLSHFPALFLTSYFNVKYSTSSTPFQNFIVSTPLPLMFIPNISLSLLNTTFISQIPCKCTPIQPKSTFGSFYLEGSEIYFNLPRKKYYSTALAQMVFILLGPTSDGLTHFNFNSIDLSEFLNEPTEPSLNCKPLKISFGPLHQYYSQIPFNTPQTTLKRKQFLCEKQKVILIPQIRERTNHFLLLNVAAKLRSVGIVVQCKKSIEELSNEGDDSRIVLLENLKKVSGYVVEPSITASELDELSKKKLGIMACVESVMNSCFKKEIKGYSTFFSGEELIQLLKPKNDVTESIATKTWRSKIYSVTSSLTKKKTSATKNSKHVQKLKKGFENELKKGIKMLKDN